jgi:hypothetical protein
MSKKKIKPIAKFIPPQRDKSFSFQIVFPGNDLPESYEFVRVMDYADVKDASPFLQGHNGNWAMVEFWTKDETLARRAATKLAQHFKVHMGEGDFTRKELGLE